MCNWCLCILLIVSSHIQHFELRPRKRAQKRRGGYGSGDFNDVDESDKDGEKNENANWDKHGKEMQLAS